MKSELTDVMIGAASAEKFVADRDGVPGDVEIVADDRTGTMAIRNFLCEVRAE